MLREKLQIILITYNRKKYFERTLSYILSEESPIKDCDILILDNASDDGTSEVAQDYCQHHSNIKHYRHPINIGGNGNICVAFERGAISGKEYFWVLCDNDKYDFSNWAEVEEQMNNKTDIICLADYVFPNTESKTKPEYQIFQLTFVPAGIYRADIISGNVLINMTYSVYTMMQQTCACAKVINNNGKIHVLSKPIVFNGLNCEDACEDNSYQRDTHRNEEILNRHKHNFWLLGYSNILSLFNDKDMAKRSFEYALLYKDMYVSWENFYDCLNRETLFKPETFSHFFEIYNMLSKERQDEFKKSYEYNLRKMFVKTNVLTPRKKLNFNLQTNRIKKMLERILSVRIHPDGRHRVWSVLGISLKTKV